MFSFRRFANTTTGARGRATALLANGATYEAAGQVQAPESEFDTFLAGVKTDNVTIDLKKLLKDDLGVTAVKDFDRFGTKDDLIKFMVTYGSVMPFPALNVATGIFKALGRSIEPFDPASGTCWCVIRFMSPGRDRGPRLNSTAVVVVDPRDRPGLCRRRGPLVVVVRCVASPSYSWSNSIHVCCFFVPNVAAL